MDISKYNRSSYHTVFIVSLVAWFSVYGTTLVNMVNTWSGSETYKHCYFILPIVVYLIYEMRKSLTQVSLKHCWYCLIPLFIGQLIYLLTDLSGINILSELAAYGTLVCLVGIVYGWRILSFLMFPLGYLVLAVPMGEELVPLLQEITANISVALVKLVDIPVYREGLYIYIPNGNFEVAEACAGIRFLISMIAIGILYAYMFYQSTWRRLTFVALSVIIPIIANGIRAFGIIYIGHKTDMQQAVGADHLVYGWFFFAFVLFLLLMIGKFWREDNNGKGQVYTIPKNPLVLGSANHAILALIIPFLLLKPAYNHYIVGNLTLDIEHSQLVTQLIKQQENDKTAFFQASFLNADNIYISTVANEDNSADIFVAEYRHDNQQQELINSNNRLYDIDLFSLTDSDSLTINVAGTAIPARVLSLVNLNGEKKKVVYWYEVNQSKSSSPLTIKKAQLMDKLTGGTGGGNVIIIGVEDNFKNLEQLNTYLTELLTQVINSNKVGA